MYSKMNKSTDFKTQSIDLRRSMILSLLGVFLWLNGCTPSSSSKDESISSLYDQSGEELDQSLDFNVSNDQSSSSEQIDQGFSQDQYVELSGEEGVFLLTVKLDGEPTAQIKVLQGGSSLSWQTNEQGQVRIELDREVLGPTTLFASHPQARTRSLTLFGDEQSPQSIELTRYQVGDNPLSPFSDPGEPDRRASTTQCGHCHLNINTQWFESPHRSSARNPIVYDLYTGRGSGWTTEEACLEAQGIWREGQVEGQDEWAFQCYFELSALGAFNESCQNPPCDSRELDPNHAYFGGCADCHAPQQNPTTEMGNQIKYGGQDLLTTRDFAFEYGVSCDVCHHVDRIDREAPAGVAGRLVIQRPHEEASRSLGAGGYLPLSFGPSADVSNPRMGISPRTHYQDGSLCMGCHQHSHQADHALVPIHPQRWPEGAIPNQSTYQEWEEGPYKEISPCNACHMPPDATVMNSSHLETFADADIGTQGGWPRPFGSTRQHRWWGPRQSQGKMLENAASLHVKVDPSSEGWQIQVQTHNSGAGHGLPTGEPMRHLLLLVDLECEGEPVFAVGGNAVQEIGGSIHQQPWVPLNELRLPKADLGDWIRVVEHFDEWIEYDGYGAFAREGRFAVHEKGLFRQETRGQAKIIAIDEQGELTLDRPLPEGTHLYLIKANPPIALGYAGQSGFSFGRVFKGQNGQLMVPHFVASDLVRDQRLKPNQSWTTHHLFPQTCSTAPLLSVRLLYRPYPLWLARQRGWTMWDQIMVQKQVLLTHDSNRE